MLYLCQLRYKFLINCQKFVVIRRLLPGWILEKQVETQVAALLYLYLLGSIFQVFNLSFYQ